MNLQVIRTLIVKDLTIYFRNRFFAVVTVLALVMFTGIYLVLPSSVDVELELALYSPDAIPDVFLTAFENQQVTIAVLDSEEAMLDAVGNEDYAGGIFLPGGILDQMTAGEETQVTVYFSANAPQELSEAVTVLVSTIFNEISYQLSDQPLNLQLSVEVLGHDFEGQAIPTRDRLLPLLAVFMLITETLGLASLMAEERSRGTLIALLVTPVKLRELIAAKGFMGVSLAFVQVFVVMLVAGALKHQPLLIVAILLLGAFLITGIGLLLATTGKDMMSIMGWALLAYLVLSIPSFGIMFPGTSAGWIKIIPSYYIVDSVHQVINYSAGWSEVGNNLIVLLVYGTALMVLGTAVLRRRLA